MDVPRLQASETLSPWWKIVSAIIIVMGFSAFGCGWLSDRWGVRPVVMAGAVLLGIGLITPPVGPTLFVGCAIGKVSMEEVAKELWPFYGAMCVALLLVTYVPAISLWLPGLTK